MASMAVKIQRVAPGGPSGWLPVIAGLVIGLLGIGLPMIGVTINLFLGSVILAVAFALIAWGCWIWEGKSPRHGPLRLITISIIAVIYFSLIGAQIRTQYKQDHPVVAPVSTPSPKPAPATPTTVITQTAKDSPCANQVAQSGSKIDCDTQKGKDDKTRH
jgi:hypothetical protein